MPWEIEVSDEFTRWYQSLTEQEIESVNFSVDRSNRRARCWGARTWTR